MIISEIMEFCGEIMRTGESGFTNCMCVEASISIEVDLKGLQKLFGNLA